MLNYFPSFSFHHLYWDIRDIQKGRKLLLLKHSIWWFGINIYVCIFSIKPSVQTRLQTKLPLPEVASNSSVISLSWPLLVLETTELLSDSVDYFALSRVQCKRYNMYFSFHYLLHSFATGHYLKAFHMNYFAHYSMQFLAVKFKVLLKDF